MLLTDAIRLLTSHGWLGGTPPDFQAALLAGATWRTLRPGQLFNRAGDTAVGMWGVASGQINLSNGLGVSDTPIGDIWLPGHWGGFGPLFMGFRAANAAPAVPSLLALVPYSHLTALLAEHPAWWEHFGRLACAYAFRFGGLAGDLLVPDSRLRLIAVLLWLADCRHRDSSLGLPLRLRISQTELGRSANLSRQLAYKTLHELEAMGAIGTGYRTITIRDAAAMRRLLEVG